ncbi:tripartite tricarboxylate transporter permease [Pontivivens nitratireducens]|uniref:Tripartite tricarboxylate transporter protein TctA n=1 Tax=Pontivivens nitratireducens TaxID=2758038 RepID=A0A6G7VK49_9RHOB|nr:tripartite tricarboxylate transporter permease [Pontibrevibacter nitratireducens]QIK40473.1 tripartite tricarboxylate transporter protein TctA [Pontibrevibacter nitratireducens]
MLDLLIQGAPLFFTWQAVLLTAAGIVAGLFIGVLPGLGPLMGIVLMLPVAFHLPPIPAMGMLIAIYVGGSAGGSISAILLRIPGTPLAAATLFDGYPMAQKGRSQDAIGLSIIASSLGGLLAGCVLLFFSPLLAAFALRFGPPEYAAMALFGLLTIAIVSEGSTIKGMVTGAFGLAIATMGTDEFTNAYRFTFGNFNLTSGPHIVPVVVGLFALSEVFVQIEGGDLTASPKIQRLRVSFRALRLILAHKVNLVRSALIGTFMGAIPGAGGDVSAFVSYAVARRLAGPDEGYGEGAEGGVVATEAANNGCCGGALIPALSLGIPGDASTAVLLAALFLLGFFPGPELFQYNADIAGGIFIAYLIGNVVLLIAGIVLVPFFGSVLKLPKAWLLPAVILLSTMGTYALQNSVFDLWVMLVFGAVGYLLRRANYPLPPIIIGMILGSVLENNLRRSLLISRDGLQIFIDRPISATILGMTGVLLVYVVITLIRGAPKAAKDEESSD